MGSPTSKMSLDKLTRVPPIEEKKRFGIAIFLKNRTSRSKEKYKEKIDFFGSTHVAKVEGFRTVKKDIDYGDVKTAKLATKDIKITTKGRESFIKTRRDSALQPKSTRFFTQKKTKRNKTKLF